MSPKLHIGVMLRHEIIARGRGWLCGQAVHKGELAGDPLVVRPILGRLRGSAQPFVGVVYRE